MGFNEPEHNLFVSPGSDPARPAGTDMLTEHPLLSEPSSVSFYNWMSNAVGNRAGSASNDSPLSRSQPGEARWAPAA